MQIKATFTANVTNDPTVTKTTNSQVKNLRLVVNHDKKNRETGEYEKTGDATWIDASLWGDLADTDIERGDLLEVTATMIDKTWERDGKSGHGLVTDYVESVVVKHRKAAGTGF